MDPDFRPVGKGLGIGKQPADRVPGDQGRLGRAERKVRHTITGGGGRNNHTRVIDDIWFAPASDGHEDQRGAITVGSRVGLAHLQRRKPPVWRERERCRRVAKAKPTKVPQPHQVVGTNGPFFSHSMKVRKAALACFCSRLGNPQEGQEDQGAS